MEYEFVKPLLATASKERITPSVQRVPGPSPSAHSVLDLQRAIGNRAVGRLLQAKLSVSHPGDAYEQEAEHLASRITAGPAPEASQAVQRDSQLEKEEDKKEHGLQRRLLDASNLALSQRQTVPEEDKDKDKMGLQRSSDPTTDDEAANGVFPHADRAVSAASTSTGQPLPSPLRRKFEHALGADLSAVRVHTGSQSTEANQAISARAYTTGNDIHFNSGEYNPSSAEGEHLLAHEVVHTVQQSGGAARSPSVGETEPLAEDVQRKTKATGRS